MNAENDNHSPGILAQLLPSGGWLLTTTRVLVVVYILYGATMYFLQRYMAFPGRQIPPPDPRPIDTEEVEIEWLPIDDEEVESWYLPPDDQSGAPPHPAVIVGHGNGELIDFLVDQMRGFTQRGIGVMLVEYPGYGRSGGAPSQESITRTFVAAYDSLVARSEIDADHILLYGRSLGAGAVCQLASKRETAAMILQSPFTSVKDFARRFLLPSYLVRDPLDNRSVLRQYEQPVLIVHGQHDNIIPHHHGKELASIAPDSDFLTYDCGHNDCPPSWTQFFQDIEAFLRKNNIPISP